MKTKALNYGKLACNTIMDAHPDAVLGRKEAFNYVAGVFLSGMMNIYRVCGDEKYIRYIKKWVDSIIVDDGVIQYFAKGALDDYMAGTLLFPLYERFSEKKYLTALKLFKGNIRNWMKNEKGGFWHKEWYPYQMWLDGLYMAGPLQMHFARYFGEEYFCDNALRQVFLMYENMKDPGTGLLFHAWDDSKNAVWADKETGLSTEVWGRAMGWYVVAILEMLEILPESHSERTKLISIEKELLEKLAKYQDAKSGMWYQVIGREEEQDNWLETSCSCLFTYAMVKAVRMGILDKEYLKNVERGFEGILAHSVSETDGKFKLSGVCIGTSVCDYNGYINRPTTENDLHGTGAFVLMCAEIARMNG